MRRTLIMAALGAVLAAGAGGQPTAPTALPTALDLPASLELAAVHGFPIRRAQEQIAARAGYIIEARARLRPKALVDGTATSTDERRIEAFGGGSRTQNSERWDLGVEVNYELTALGVGRVNLRARSDELEAAEHAFRAVVSDTLLAVAEAYYGALLAETQIAVQEQAVKLYQEQLALARNRYDSGSGPQFDVLRAEVTLANAQPALVRARNARRLAIENLRQAIGLPYAPGQSHEDVRLHPGWDLNSDAPAVADAVAAALRARPEAAQAETNARVAEDNIDVARSGTGPTVTAYARYDVFSESFSDDLTDVLHGYQLGVRGVWPLHDAGATRGRVRAAEAAKREAELRVGETLLNIEVDVRRALLNLAEAREIVLTSDLVIRQADEALRLANNRYTAGAATQLDVLQSQLDLTEARLNQAQASHDYSVARARLNRALGQPPLSVEPAAAEVR